MSKIRRSGSARVSVVKWSVVCSKCGNKKAHTNGLWLKCTLCKSMKVNVVNHSLFKKFIEDRKKNSPNRG